MLYEVITDHFSADDLRRIAFHVRINRPMSLFARCWLLVEGETEIWLLAELANICGYSLRAEGVRIIEYAQCGYAPLIKVAKQLGIEWHLMADGDQAGEKYISGARALLHGDRERERLTGLHERDIEHFLFMNGFESVFRRITSYNVCYTKLLRVLGLFHHRQRQPGFAAVADGLVDDLVGGAALPGTYLGLPAEYRLKAVHKQEVRNNFV